MAERKKRKKETKKKKKRVQLQSKSDWVNELEFNSFPTKISRENFLLPFRGRAISYFLTSLYRGSSAHNSTPTGGERYGASMQIRELEEGVNVIILTMLFNPPSVLR